MERRGFVRRVQPSTGESTEATSRSLDEVVFQPMLDRAARAGEERELHAAAMRPIWKLIEADEAASMAQRKLVDLLRDAHRGPITRPDSWTGGAPGGPASAFRRAFRFLLRPMTWNGPTPPVEPPSTHTHTPIWAHSR